MTREGNLWVTVVRDLPAGAADAERMVDLEPEARDLIAGLQDCDPEDFEIVWHDRHGGRDLSVAVDELHRRETAAEEAGLSMRNIAGTARHLPSAGTTARRHQEGRTRPAVCHSVIHA